MRTRLYPGEDLDRRLRPGMSVEPTVWVTEHFQTLWWRHVVALAPEANRSPAMQDCSPPPPAPCRKRNRMSIPSEGAIPHRNEILRDAFPLEQLGTAFAMYGMVVVGGAGDRPDHRRSIESSGKDPVLRRRSDRQGKRRASAFQPGSKLNKK